MQTRLISALAVGSFLLTGCLSGGGGSSSRPSTPSPDVTITYTSHGVPHIEAQDYYGLGYGVAHAHAEDNLCTLAEQILKMQGNKSRYFGPGENMVNLLSDVAYKALDFETRAEALYDSMSDSSQQLIEGYAEGYNAAVAAYNSPQDYPSPCRGAEWVQPITPTILAAYHLDLATLASTRNFLAAMAIAQPPTAPIVQARQADTLLAQEQGPRPLRSAYPLTVQLDAEKVLTNEGIGSNGWALGSQRVNDANSLLLGNPHFPWDGELRFFEAHLKIPGELEVHGANMLGLPVITMGFNKDIGWTHTVSQAKRFTLYQLALDPSDPLRYYYDGALRDIEVTTVEIDVQLPNGSVVPHSHQLYFSHYGPMVDLSSLSPALGWTGTAAITYRDVNIDNNRGMDQWLAMGLATSTQEVMDSFATHQGLPWVNTMMIDKEGNTSYIDASVTPLLSPQAEGYWRAAMNTPELAGLWQDGAGQILLPGHQSQYAWANHADAVVPGIVPFSQAPRQTSTDYVYNANSSHWLSNLDAPLEGYSIIYGPERSIRSPRTRYNAQMISDPHAFGLTLADQRFDIDSLKAVLDMNGSLFGGSFRNQLVQRCTQHPQIIVDGQTLDVSEACGVLDRWDGLYNLDSRGAHLMREYLQGFRVPLHRDLRDDLFAVPFDAADAAYTPGGLSQTMAPEELLKPLYDAAERLKAEGIALDAPLGSIQYVLKSPAPEHKIAVHGGQSFEGLFNMISQGSRSTSDLATILTGEPVPDSASLSRRDEGNGEQSAYRITYGSSFVLALAYVDGEPQAQMYLSYSQAHDPESAFFADQTELFSDKQWRDMAVTEADIAADTVRVVELNLQ